LGQQSDLAVIEGNLEDGNFIQVSNKVFSQPTAGSLIRCADANAKVTVVRDVVG
jgi:hypothetical protein